MDNSVTIKGLVDIKTNKNTALFARGGNISIGGGIITAQNYDSMWTVGKGRIDLNMITDEDGHIQDAGTNPLVINGNAATVTTWYGSGGTINMGLATDKSVFNGQTYGDGEQNIWLKNGAVWNNKPEIYKEWNATQTTVVDRESTATNLHGGDSLKMRASSIIPVRKIDSGESGWVCKYLYGSGGRKSERGKSLRRTAGY